MIRLAPRRILADDVDRAQIPTIHRLEHLAEVPALLHREVGAAPRSRELFVELGVFQFLETRQPGRDRAHVAAALDVVLAAQGIQAAPITPHLAGEEGEVDERDYVIDRVVVLGDPEGPADHPGLRAPVREGDLLDRGRRYAGVSLGALQRVRLNASRELLVAIRRP